MDGESFLSRPRCSFSSVIRWVLVHDYREKDSAGDEMSGPFQVSRSSSMFSAVGYLGEARQAIKLTHFQVVVKR